MSGLVRGPWFVSEPPQATSHYTAHADGTIRDNLEGRTLAKTWSMPKEEEKPLGWESLTRILPREEPRKVIARTPHGTYTFEIDRITVEDDTAVLHLREVKK